MRNKGMIAAVVATAVLAFFLFLLAYRGVVLVALGGVVPGVLGAGILVLAALGVWVVASTWISGYRVHRLTTLLRAEGDLPDVSGLPRMASGRVDRAAADAWFADRKAELEETPDDWRAWYRLAHAYDIAGDRRRARETMRTAVDLEARAPS